MLAIITENGTSLIDPIDFKNSPNSFPTSSSLECCTNAWSPDNSQLYLANRSSIKIYAPSESLLEELYHGSDDVTCLAVKDKSRILFFAAANKVWSLDCAHSPGKVLSSLEPHKSTVSRISISNDGTLLASVSASAVFVHDLTLLSYTRLKGLPDRKPVTCCLFHRHSRTALLLSVGRDFIVYDSMQPAKPRKTVRIPGGGDIVGVSTSPFSKTLVAAVTSNGDVALVDLDKDNGVLKTVSVKTPLTCCAFTAEGAAIYLGSEEGRLLILDLRSLEKVPKSFIIGDGNAPIKTINVQAKSKIHFSDTAGRKVKSSSTTVVNSSPQRLASSSTRSTSTNSIVLGSGFKSPGRVTVAPKIRGGGGVTPKKKLLSLARTPLSETKNLGLGAQLADSRFPTMSRRVKPLKLQRGNEQEENRESQAQPLSPTSFGITEPTNARRHTKLTLTHKMGEIERLGLRSAPESISGHLAVVRIRSSPLSNDGSKDQVDGPKYMARRVISSSNHNAVSSSKAIDGIPVRRQQREQRFPTPDNDDDHFDLSSPELPHEPVTPISLGKNATQAPIVSTVCTDSNILGLSSPEIAKWSKDEDEKGKGKETAFEVKKTRFAQQPDAGETSRGSNESEDEAGPEILGNEQRDEEREPELSLQVSPRRPTGPPTCLQSPYRPSASNINMNVAAQDFLRNIVHDVMYDFQRETKAEMMGLHLDLVRMGRGWKRELREIMEEWNEEIRVLRTENMRLKEENERLRRG